jgi:hypothetical protein
MKKLSVIACFLLIASVQFCYSQWEQCNSGLTNLLINELGVKDNYIISGTTDGVFISSNDGNNWTIKNY